MYFVKRKLGSVDWAGARACVLAGNKSIEWLPKTETLSEKIDYDQEKPDINWGTRLDGKRRFPSSINYSRIISSEKCLPTREGNGMFVSRKNAVPAIDAGKRWPDIT